MDAHQILPATTEEREQEPVPIPPSQKESDPHSISDQKPDPSTSQEQGGSNKENEGNKEEEGEGELEEEEEDDDEYCEDRVEETGEGYKEKEAIISKDDIDKVKESTAPLLNCVKLLYKVHLILNVMFGILFASLAVLRWNKGRAEFNGATILICLVDFSVHILVWVLPQSMISRNYAALETYMRTAAVVLDVYAALLMVNIQYIIIGIIPFMIFLFIGALAWKSRETGSSQDGSSIEVHTMRAGKHNNNEEVLPAKNLFELFSSKSSSDKLACFELVSYLLQLSLVTWTQYKGQQGFTPIILSDFLLFLGSALGALGAMLASPLAGVDSRAVSVQVLPVLHKTCTVLLFIAVHTLAAEWRGEDMIFVCLPELIAVLVWFVICFGKATSVSSFMSHNSKFYIRIPVLIMLAVCLGSLDYWHADDMDDMRVSWFISAFWISFSSSALSRFHAWLLLDWPGSTSDSNTLIQLLNVASEVGTMTAVIFSVILNMMAIDQANLPEAISSFEHKFIVAAVPIICLISLSVRNENCRRRHPERPETQFRVTAPAGNKFYVNGELSHMLVTKLYPKLDELLKAPEHTLPSDVREDVTLVQSKLQNMHAMITWFVSSSYSDVQARAWIDKVHELVCDIEDLVDLLLLGNHGEPGMQERRKRVREAMDHLFSPHVYSSPANPVGLDGPRNKVVEMVAPADLDDKLKVVSIVGMPGSGKTALASQVYGIVHRFERRSWLPLRLMDAHSAIAYMLFHLTGDSTILLSGYGDYDHVIRRLKHCLQKKRYLVILDGLESTQTWTVIKDCLPENYLGSRIIITTRSEDVASFACGPYQYHVYRHSLLDRGQAEILFYQKAFGTARGTLPDDLKVVSDQILDKCDGLPLAILSVGRVLASKPSTLDEFKRPGLPWQELQSMKYAIQYIWNTLPTDVTMCLLYLSIFPVKHVIEVERLVRLWIAEGFINAQHRYRPSTTNQEKVNIANGYIRTLVDTNLIMHPSKGLNESKTISIHPVIHSFIVCMSMEQDFVTLVHSQQDVSPSNSQQEDVLPSNSQQEDVSPSNGTARRLSLLNNGIEDQNSLQKKEKEDQAAARSYGKKLRSVTVFSHTSGMPLLAGMSVLHVLDLDGCKGPVCLDGLCQLFLLRYLSLRGTDVSELPAQIGRLTYLETLDVRSTKVKEIPPSILMLQKLMHLLAGNAKLPCGIGKMKTLFALLCPDVATNSTSIMQELSEIDNLTELELFCESSQEVSGEKKEVAFRSDGFHRLDKLCVQFGYSSLTFDTGALPNVQLLVLKLDKGLPQGSTNVSGIEHLQSLKRVHVKYSHDDANARFVLAAVKDANAKRQMSMKPVVLVDLDEE